VIWPDEGVNHEKKQSDEDGDEELIGTAPVEEDDPTCTTQPI
jgi:hypothetical protein